MNNLPHLHTASANASEHAQLLLDFADAISPIRNRDELMRTIFAWLKPIFRYDAAIMGIVEQKSGLVTVFANDFLPEMLRNDFFQRLLRRKFKLAGTPFEVLMEQPAPLIITPEVVQNVLGKFLPLTMLQRVAGVKQALVAPLRVGRFGERGGETFGFLNLASRNAEHFTEQDRILFERMLEQCATAIRNIFVFEQLESRNTEINLQMRLHAALQGIYSVREATSVLATTLEDRIPSSLTGILTDGVWIWLQKGVRGEWLMQNETAAEAFISDFISNEASTQLYLGEEFHRICADVHFFKALHENEGIESVLIAPIPLQTSSNHASLLVLAEQQPYGFSEQDAELVNSCMPLLSLCLGNIRVRESARKKAEIFSQSTSKEGIAHNSATTTRIPLMVPVEAGITGVIGNSSVLRDVISAVRQVAPTQATVLVFGETGTGKERIARSVHELSPRRTKPFVAVNCAALPSNLIESELFGHEKGAFTGATERRIGKFEAAQGGTIFLDEVGELPFDVQAKLLRVLQERELERVGGKIPVLVDVRVVAATNRDLQREVAEGRFRADLYYRLNVFPLTLPPLRERREDIPHLTVHFIRKYSERLNKRITTIDYDSMQALIRCSWQGNIRELENVIERSVITSQGEVFRVTGLPEESPSNASNTRSGETLRSQPYSLKTHTEAEREHIMRVLEETGWRVSGERGAAAILKMKPTTLEYRMKKLGIRRAKSTE